MTILLNCCYLNINPVVEGLQENDCYISAGPPFRPKDTEWMMSLSMPRSAK